jgi:Abnormal spindle-like microcephaly-assoc'd, ASPM-SPD-2-Hydin
LTPVTPGDGQLVTGPTPFLNAHPGDPPASTPAQQPRRPSGSVPLLPAADPQPVPAKAQPTIVDTHIPIVPVGPAKPTWPDVVPPAHHTSEANTGHPAFPVPIMVHGIPTGQSQDLGGVFPEWINVDDAFETVTLEGICTGDASLEPSPHVSFQDFPTSHYTHDFCFKVAPDATVDNRFTNLLGIGNHGEVQELIEVEWECGLGADNDGNICSSANRIGSSAGFFSAGHQRRSVIWNWPTVGDWVHVMGRWIWDRGHTPATEIHPPRLVAVRRHLPEVLQVSGDGSAHTVVATRVDLFASGDGGALRNNRGLVPFAVPVNMADTNYEIEVAHLLAPPTPDTKLEFLTQAQPGNSFGAPLSIGPSSNDRQKAVIIIPWHDQNVAANAVLACTVWLYWDSTPSYAANQRPRVFNVSLDSIHVYNNQDPWPSDGEYRVFVEAGGKWWFVNEMPSVSDILQDGLGDTGDADPPAGQPWGIGRQAQVCVLPGDTFRVHACGWEADGADTVFGHLIDPDHPHDADLIQLINDTLLTPSVFANGSEDDPIGEVNTIYAAPTYGTDQPEHLDASKGDVSQSSVWGQQSTDPNDSYALKYSIVELPWAPAILVPQQVSFGTVPVGEIDTRNVQIQSTGTADLHLTIGASPAGSPFRWHAVSTTLPFGSAYELEIEFAPKGTGPAKATLFANSDAPGSPVAVTVGGQGTKAIIPR